jgi:DNA-binding transcriptional ArsR family regulator
VPSRSFVTKEMATLMGVLAHPQRIRIVEELRNRELDVNSLQAILEITHSRVSQHLSVLRSHRIVVERREGRSVFYRLVQPRMAKWMLEGFEFLAVEAHYGAEMREALNVTRQLWATLEPARGGAGVAIGNPRPQDQED